MDLKQIEYILKIAEEKNITHAAEKLFITQSALNQQLLKLEKELGCPLFYRSRTDWRPTPAGEIYLDAARQILISLGFIIRGMHYSMNIFPRHGLSRTNSVYVSSRISFYPVIWILAL